MKYHNLINEFDNISKMKTFEIDLKELGISKDKSGNENYYYFNIARNDYTLYIVSYDFINIDFDDCFSLDEHLQSLYGDLVESVLNGKIKF